MKTLAFELGLTDLKDQVHVHVSPRLLLAVPIHIHFRKSTSHEMC